MSSAPYTFHERVWGRGSAKHMTLTDLGSDKCEYGMCGETATEMLGRKRFCEYHFDNAVQAEVDNALGK